MLKHKKFLSLLLVLPVFTAFSCATVSETYTVIKNGDDNNKLQCVIPEKWKEVYPAPFNLEDDFNELTVTFDNNPITKIAKSLEEAKDPTTFFICTSESVPSKSIIGNFQVNKTNTDVNTTLTFYVAHLEYKGESKESMVYLSQKITINVYNEGAFAGPWVIPVVTIGVALIAFAMVFFVHRYKAKKEGKI